MNRLFLFIFLFFLACQNTTVLPSYSGAINEVVVVAEDNIWESSVVDTLRRTLSAEVEGLAWKESTFDVIQIPKAAFSRIFETHRNIIIIQKKRQHRSYIRRRSLCMKNRQGLKNSRFSIKISVKYLFLIWKSGLLFFVIFFLLRIVPKTY